MPLQDIAQINISVADLPPALPGQGIPLGLFTLSAEQAEAFGDALTVELGPTTFRPTLAGLGIASSDPAWVGFTDVFSQERKPSLALLGRRGPAVAQAIDFVLGGFDLGDYAITIQGVTATETVAGVVTIEAIRDALLAKVNALELPNALEVTATAISTTTVRVTSDAAGVPFLYSSSAPEDNITESVFSASYGVPEDLTLLAEERNDWYALFGGWRDTPTILAAADYLEAAERIYLAQTSDVLANTVGATSDVGSLLQAQAYFRTSAWYSSDDAQWVDGAILGRMLPEVPGSRTWAAKRLASVTGDVFTSTAGLRSKNYCWLEQYTDFVPPVASTRSGTVSSGSYLDLVLLRDYLARQLRITAFQLAASEVPYSDAGGQQIKMAVEETIRRVGAETGALDLETLIVEAARKADQSPANRLARKWGGTTFAVVAQGRVHSLEITGVIEP